MRAESRKAGRAQLWRYTADLLFLIENPYVREAFFPSGARPFVVEPASPADRDDVRDALEEVRAHTSLLRVLGTYASASDPG